MKLIGRYFFEDDVVNHVTMTEESYKEMFKNLLWSVIENPVGMWFQQDGATAHTARESIQLLRQRFN